MKDTIYVAAQTISGSGFNNSKDYFEILFWVINAVILGLTVYVIRKSPTDAVKIGRELNDTQQKDDAKRNLFFTLFSYRGSPVHQHFVDGLNRIDIVFFDTPKVTEAWHNYYDSLHREGLVDEGKIWRLLRIELLSQMAQSLGYGDLKQMNFEQHYYPKGHGYQDQEAWEFRFHHLEYLKTGKSAFESQIEWYESFLKNQPPVPPEPPKDIPTIL